MEKRVFLLLVLVGCAPVSEAAPATATPRVLTSQPEPVAVVVAEAWAAPAEEQVEAEPTPPPRAPLIVAPEVEPSVPHQPAPRYAKLFERYKRYHYVVIDDLDPHAEDGRQVVTKAKVACDVIDVRTYEGALGVELTCAGMDAPDHGDSGIPSRFTLVSAPGGLWMPSFLPADQNDLGTVIFDPPTLPDVPETRARTLARPRGTDGEVDVCTRRVSASPGSTCFDERCSVENGYGDTRWHLCVSQRGIESFSTENVGGPRKVSWQLQRVERLPEPSCSG